MAHSIACDNLHEDAQKWWEMWSSACDKCMATGALEWFENHGPDIGSEHLSDYCVCLYDGYCPRCAVRVFAANGGSAGDDDFLLAPDATCTNCGWRLDNMDDAAPYDPQSEPYCCEVAWPELEEPIEIDCP